MLTRRMTYEFRVTSFGLRVVMLVVFVSMGAAVWGQAAANGRAARASALEDLLGLVEGAVGGTPRISKTKEGYLRFVGAPRSGHFSVEPSKRKTAGEAADAFVAKWQNLFVRPSAAVEFNRVREKMHKGVSYVRYEQRYAGLKVFAAEIVVKVNGDGGIRCALSDIMRDTEALDEGKVSVAATIDAATAQMRGIEFLSSEHSELEFDASEAVLMVYVPSVVGPDGATHLVWQVDVCNVGAAVVKDRVLVDAHNGAVVFRYPLIHDALERNIYDSYTSTWYDEESDWPTGVADVDNAYDYLEDTYYFYSVNHSRDSINGGGMVLEVYVREDMENARWDGDEEDLYMEFGLGWAVDDVVAHEYTHGVTQYTSGLVYANESGAINESFSDMWGEWVDLGNEAGNDAPEVRWLIGEDLQRGAIRNMADPTEYGDPDRMRSGYWQELVIPEGLVPGVVIVPGPINDYGGVHRNSGVGNKLCYLLTDGGSFNGYTITPLEVEDAADLFYECQLSFTPGASYEDLHDALLEAAEPEDYVNVDNACKAVELDQPIGTYRYVTTTAQLHDVIENDVEDRDRVVLGAAWYFGMDDQFNEDKWYVVNPRGKRITIRSLDPYDPTWVESTIIFPRDVHPVPPHDYVVNTPCKFESSTELEDCRLVGVTIVAGLDKIPCVEFMEYEEAMKDKYKVKGVLEGADAVIEITGGSSPTISDCRIIGYYDHPYYEEDEVWSLSGIYCERNNSRVLVKDCKIRDFVGASGYLEGIKVQNGIYWESAGTVVEGCDIEDNKNTVGVQCKGWIEGEVTIKGCTISMNEDSNGIYCEALSKNINIPLDLTITDCTVSANERGMLCNVGGDGSTATIADCTITGNKLTSSNDGAGIRMVIGSCDGSIRDCIITGNETSKNGGGIHIRQCGHVTVADCRITGNYAAGSSTTDGGGGIYVESGGSVTIEDCVISHNRTNGGGAGIFNQISGLEVVNCWITGNTVLGSDAAHGGGGISSFAALDVINCAVSGNQALVDGGGILFTNYWPGTNIKQCTIADNRAGGDGGGIFAESGGSDTTYLENNVLWGNSADTSGDNIFNDIGRFLNVSYCDVQGGKEGVGCDGSCNPPTWDDASNINADPLVEPGSWVGDTWVDGDYHIGLGSPCIDAGTDAGVDEDIEGNPRPINYPGVDNNGEEDDYDMGAYEVGLGVDLSLDYQWMYQSLPGQTNSDLTATVSIVDDPWSNSTYTYEWEIILPSDVSLEPRIISGGGTSDTWWTFAARGCDKPAGLSDSGGVFKVRVTVTGSDNGFKGTAEAEFGIRLLGDVNNDTVVNVADRSIANVFWVAGSAGPFTLRDCDVNADGVVNVADRSIANVVWRGGLGQKSVSEPCPFGAQAKAAGMVEVMVSQWEFEEGSGSTAGDSAYTNDGDVHGATWTAGKIGGALEFDGDGDYVKIEDHCSIDFEDSITMSAWINVDGWNDNSPPNWNADVIARKDNAYILYRYWDNIDFYLCGPDHRLSYPKSNIELGRWYHIAASYDTNDMKNVRVYEWGLSAEEIWQIYIQGAWVSHWKFDEGAGSTAYDSAGNNDGTLNGPQWVSGKTGDYALDFDGEDDYVDLGNDDALKPPLPVTIAGWVKLSDSGKLQRLISIDEQSSKYYGLWLEVQATDKVSVSFGDGRGGASQAYRRSKVGTTTLGTGTWYHVAGVMRGAGDMDVYVNGLDDGGSYSGSGLSLAYSSGSSSIGYEDGARYYFDGVIDDVRFYDRALSAGEVMQVYGEGLFKAFGPSPVDGATGMNPDRFLRWQPGKCAATHDVYFGTDAADVNDATTSSAEYIGNQDVNIWDPWGLEAETTYYWRIDEVNGPNTWKGDVWSFTTWAVPMSWWKFDEGSRTTAYDSAGSNDGNIIGEPNWTSGQINGALDFDGVDDYVDLDAHIGDYQNLSEGTVSMWLNNIEDEGGAFFSASRSDAVTEIYFQILADGKLKIRICPLDPPGSLLYWISDDALPSGWHHFVYSTSTSPSGNWMYLDGEPITGDYTKGNSSTNAFFSHVPNQDNLRMGNILSRGLENREHFNGLIDDVRIYDEALSAKGVEELYEEGSGD